MVNTEMPSWPCVGSADRGDGLSMVFSEAQSGAHPAGMP